MFPSYIETSHLICYAVQYDFYDFFLGFYMNGTLVVKRVIQFAYIWLIFRSETHKLSLIMNTTYIWVNLEHVQGIFSFCVIYRG